MRNDALRGFALGRSGIVRLIAEPACLLFMLGRMAAGFQYQDDAACHKDRGHDSQESDCLKQGCSAHAAWPVCRVAAASALPLTLVAPLAVLIRPYLLE